MATFKITKEQSDRIQQHLAAIGALCYNWSHLDNVIVLAIGYFSECDEETLACLLSTSKDTSQRCEIATKLLILRVGDGPWRKCACETFRLIQNKFCDKRNRLVHDEWEFHEDDIVRTTRAVRIAKSQAYRGESLTYKALTLTQPKEIEDFVLELVQVTFGISILASQFEKQRNELQTLMPPEALQTLYKAYFPEPHPNKNPRPKQPQKASRVKV